MTLKTRTLGAQGPELTTIGSGLPRSYSWVVGGLAGCVSTLASTLLRRRAGSVERNHEVRHRALEEEHDA